MSTPELEPADAELGAALEVVAALACRADAVANALPLLQAISDALDSLGVAMCAFDADDATLLWNRSFLRSFPEHAAHIKAGDPYRANLRRFYEAKLSAREMPSIERYIDEGVARHGMQRRPYAFAHRGMRLFAASLPLPGVGRVRIWKAEPLRGEVADGGAAAAGDLPFAGAQLFDYVADAVMVTDADDRIVWINEPFVLMYGLRDRAAARGLGFEDIYRAAWQGRQAEDPALFEHGLAVLVEYLRFAGAPFEVPLPDDRWSRVIDQRSPDGKRFFAHADITVLKQQQQQLMLAERRARDSEALLHEKSQVLEATLENMEQGVMMVDAAGVVAVCNRRAIELLGLPAALMASKPIFTDIVAYQWRTDEFATAPKAVMDFVKSGGIPEEPQFYDRRRPDGRVIEVQVLPVAGGGMLRTYTDITARKGNEERTRHIARHDGLTALVNREAFLECLMAAANASDSTHEIFAVHYIDLDGFKTINDRHGHIVGDKVLALVARRMRHVARDADVVARMGGDEFAILQYGAQDANYATRLAERMLQSISLPMEIESHHLHVGASIGIALGVGPGSDPDALLRNADAAMYAAKAQGRGCVRLHEAGPRAAASEQIDERPLNAAA